MNNSEDGVSREGIKPRSNARIQHYVPQFILNSFAKKGRGKSLQIHVFDKQESRAFLSSVENVFAERDFNTFASEAGIYCMEDSLSVLETRAAPLIEQIIARRKLTFVSDEEHATIAMFVALHRIRGKSIRIEMEALANAVRKVVVANHDGDMEALDEIDRAREPNFVKLQSLQFMASQTAELAKYAATKVPVLFSSPEEAPFIIGDTPVTLHNDKTFGPYGSLGFAVPGIQIYFPLSPTLCLALVCPTIVEGWKRQLEAAGNKIAQMKSLVAIGSISGSAEARAALPIFENHAENLRLRLDGVQRGNAIICEVENVTFMNSLQVGQAERYVASRDGNFRLAMQMIADNEKFRKGHRAEIN